jgi:hypothetical protein
MLKKKGTLAQVQSEISLLNNRMLDLIGLEEHALACDKVYWRRQFQICLEKKTKLEMMVETRDMSKTKVRA